MRPPRLLGFADQLQNKHTPGRTLSPHNLFRIRPASFHNLETLRIVAGAPEEVWPMLSHIPIPVLARSASLSGQVAGQNGQVAACAPR